MRLIGWGTSSDWKEFASLTRNPTGGHPPATVDPRARTRHAQATGIVGRVAHGLECLQAPEYKAGVSHRMLTPRSGVSRGEAPCTSGSTTRNGQPMGSRH